VKMLPSLLLTTTTSRGPSPVKSPIATAAGMLSVGYATADANIGVAHPALALCAATWCTPNPRTTASNNAARTTPEDARIDAPPPSSSRQGRSISKVSVPADYGPSPCHHGLRGWLVASAGWRGGSGAGAGGGAGVVGIDGGRVSTIVSSAMSCSCFGA